MYLLNSRIAGEHVSQHLWVIQNVLHHGIVHHLTHCLLHLLWITHSSQALLSTFGWYYSRAITQDPESCARRFSASGAIDINDQQWRCKLQFGMHAWIC